MRTRLQMAGWTRELALFNLALDGKLRGCDLVRLRVRDLAHGESVLGRTSVMPQKVAEWVGLMLGDPPMYGTHSRRRTQAALIDQRTQNCRTLPLLLRQRQVERATGIKVPGERHVMKPGRRDRPVKVKITDATLTELKRQTWNMGEAFGLDAKIDAYKGIRPISFYR